MAVLTSLRREGDRLLIFLSLIKLKACHKSNIRIMLVGWWRVLDASPRASFHRKVKLHFLFITQYIRMFRYTLRVKKETDIR